MENLYLPNQPTRLTGKEVAELRKVNARLKKATALFLDRPKLAYSIYRKIMRQLNLSPITINKIKTTKE